jgi:hypothetical protein
MTRATTIVALALAAGMAPQRGSAQGVRGDAVSTVRSIEIQPLRLDTIARGQVVENEDGTFTFEGQRVACTPGFAFCTRYIGTPVERAIAFVQDVGFTAWGLGARGLSATVSLRARAELGGAFLWPRSNDAFDAMLAYGELNRDRWRVRLGRQRTTGGLGFAGFDGASVLFEPLDRTTVEAYGGRSLARGLYEPRHEALRGIEDFVPDRNAYLIGAVAEAEPFAGTRLALRYQREIWSDRSALLSERASLDLSTDRIPLVRLVGAADWDFAFGRVGKAHLTARTAWPSLRSLSVEATARRYVPYFELWTIWGYFNPVAYHEAELRARAVPWPFATVTVFGGYRRYSEANAPVIFSPLIDDAMRVGASARFVLAHDITIDGGYVMERGFGAFLSSGDVAVSFAPIDRVTLTLDGTAFQQIEEFRVGEGVVWGGGGGAEFELGARSAISAGADVYRQTFENRPGQPDWNQLRLWAVLRLGFGRDAAMADR